MATGVKPRDEDSQLTRSDLEVIQDAMKCKKFRELLTEYCDEVRDPANQALYQKEMVQLEKERGYDVTFINPKGGYVIKTSVAGDRKAFINICSNENVGKPSYKVQDVDGKRGMSWQIPYSLTPPREEYDNKRQRCVIYDVVFHSDTLRMAEVNKQFRDIVNKTAFDGLLKTYNIHLDNNNVRFPKSYYKGMSTAAVIRKEDPDFKPPEEEESDHLSPEILEKLYPQHLYSENMDAPTKEKKKETTHLKKQERKSTEFTHVSNDGYTVPKYVIKLQKNVDFQEYTYHRDSKQHSAIPSHLVIEVNLPLLSSTKDCILDVQEKTLCLTSNKAAKYKLEIALPYSVNDECGSAKFDKTKHKLIVTLPVIKKNMTSSIQNDLKADSGVESEEYSGSQSDEDSSNLVVELSSTSTETPSLQTEKCTSNNKQETFFELSYSFILPSYTHNVLDDVIAFTFHVKNTEPNSVKVKNDNNKIYIKFTSVGSGFVPIHYAAIIIFEDSIKFDNVSGEAWDNNVILQLEHSGNVPHKFQIGVSEESMTGDYLDVSQVKKDPKKKINKELECAPVVEVTNLSTETNIVVSSNNNNIEYDEDDFESPTSQEKEIVWTESGHNENGAKSILRKPMSYIRSYSESSAGDVASSMDYISSDCIPEESSFKKTVRFSDVIAKQVYRYNSSIEGQKKKNQRKKSKKRCLERRKSESEAEEDFSSNTCMTPKPRLKSVLKPRHDSGLADTSDAETECKNIHYDLSPKDTNEEGDTREHDEDDSVFNIVENTGKVNTENEPSLWESKMKKSVPLTCENIKHNTDLYNPDRLNKGQYQEVSFKNDLIFDLDM